MADTSERLCIVGFGEVLWDVFPEYKVPGGAPFNVIAHSKIMGADAHIISATGTDRNGYSLREYIRSKGISTDYLQLSSVLNTGTVDVTTNRNGEPTYRINEPVAWDNIEYNDKMVDLVVRAKAFIYGTLASRSEISFNSLMKLLDYSNLSVLDLNIRQEYFTRVTD